MSEFAFDKLVICGVGLIGGSLALSLRRANTVSGCGEIVGIDRSAACARRAVELGVVDQACELDDAPAVAAALAGADIVVLATPVAQTASLLERIVPHLAPHALITDVGSTKGDVVAAARRVLGSEIGRFVPAHPISGREMSGVDAALDDLFVDRHAVVCPLPENSEASLSRVTAMWQATGARTRRMSVAEHDRTFASVSHLPHVLAFAYMAYLLEAPDAARRMDFAAGGFRDFTRIAASSPEMWRDICLANRVELLGEIDAYAAALARLRHAVDAADGAALEATFVRARSARSTWQTTPANPASAGQSAAQTGEDADGGGK